VLETTVRSRTYSIGATFILVTFTVIPPRLCRAGGLGTVLQFTLRAVPLVRRRLDLAVDICAETADVTVRSAPSGFGEPGSP
jgi:hypothetical protein